MHQHLWIRVCAVCARFGQENGASEGETLEQPTKDHPEEITKTLHGRFCINSYFIKFVGQNLIN